MKKLSKVLAATILSLLTITSCQKEEAIEKMVPAKTKAEILVSKEWKLSAMTVDPPIFGQTDMYAMLSACEKDNTLKFSQGASNTLLTDEGGNVCAGRDQQTTTMWSLENDELSMNGFVYKIHSMDEEKFTASHDITMGGNTYKMTSTYQ